MTHIRKTVTRWGTTVEGCGQSEADQRGREDRNVGRPGSHRGKNSRKSSVYFAWKRGWCRCVFAEGEITVASVRNVARGTTHSPRRPQEAGPRGAGAGRPGGSLDAEEEPLPPRTVRRVDGSFQDLVIARDTEEAPRPSNSHDDRQGQNAAASQVPRRRTSGPSSVGRVPGRRARRPDGTRR